MSLARHHGAIQDYVRFKNFWIFFFSLAAWIPIFTWKYSLPANQDWAAQEQSLRIFNLQLERERLKRRQQEIAKLNVSWIRELCEI